jgi:hypothetical protein
MSAVAGNIDFYMDQGSTWEKTFQLIDANGEPVSVSGATPRGKMRSAPESTTVIATFTGSIVDADDGKVKLSLTAAETAAIAANNSGAGQFDYTKYVYDIEILFADSTVQSIVYGLIFFRGEVSR